MEGPEKGCECAPGAVVATSPAGIAGAGAHARGRGQVRPEARGGRGERGWGSCGAAAARRAPSPCPGASIRPPSVVRRRRACVPIGAGPEEGVRPASCPRVRFTARLLLRVGGRGGSDGDRVALGGEGGHADTPPGELIHTGEARGRNRRPTSTPPFCDSSSSSASSATSPPPPLVVPVPRTEDTPCTH